METGSGRAIGLAPFHSRGALKGFVVSGRWPDSTKEWAQLLMAAVRVASLPGLLSTTTVFGVREELPEAPPPDTVGLVIAEGPVVGESAIAPGYFADHLPPALLMLHPVGDHALTAGVCGCGIRVCIAARATAFGPRTSRCVGRGRIRRHGHLDGQSRRSGPHQPPRHRHPGNAACRLANSSPRARNPKYGNPNIRLTVRASVCCGGQRRGVAPNRRVDILAKARPANRTHCSVGETFDEWPVLPRHLRHQSKGRFQCLRRP